MRSKYRRILTFVIGLPVIAASDNTTNLAAAFPKSSRDTVHELGARAVHANGEVNLVNRGATGVRLDSLDVRVDRARHRSLALEFSVVSFTDMGWNHEKIFYWSEKPGHAWLSGPVVIPARDSVRVFRVRLDRCPKCNVRATPHSPQAEEIVATVTLRSKASPRDSVGFVVKGWYLQR